MSERFSPCMFERYLDSGFRVFAKPGVLDLKERKVVWKFEGGESMELFQRDAVLSLLKSSPERAGELEWLWESIPDAVSNDKIALEHGKFSLVSDE